MKNWYQKLNIYYQTGVWTLLISGFVTICLIPLFFFDLMEIPLGILLGGSFSALYYLLAGRNHRQEMNEKALKLDVVLLIVRFILFAGILVGLALLYYLADVKIFNIFAFVGSYTASLLIYLFVSRKEGKK